MTIDAKYLSHILSLFPRIPMVEDVAALADTLGEAEEILPWLHLRKAAFADEPKLDAAIRALAKHNVSSATRRAAGTAHAILDQHAKRAYEEALHALVVDHSVNQTLARSADAALVGAVRRRPPHGPFDAQHRVESDGN